VARLNAVVFSASIENEAAIRRWVESVQEQAGAAQQALDELAALLNSRPHVSITLTRGESGSTCPEDPDGQHSIGCGCDDSDVLS
jgi:hypothetical protein